MFLFAFLSTSVTFDIGLHVGVDGQIFAHL